MPTDTPQFQEIEDTPTLPPMPQFNMSEAQRFLLLSILIGIFAGLMVVCFHITIDFIRWYAVGTLAEKSWLAMSMAAPGQSTIGGPGVP